MDRDARQGMLDVNVRHCPTTVSGIPSNHRGRLSRRRFAVIFVYIGTPCQAVHACQARPGAESRTIFHAGCRFRSFQARSRWVSV